MNDICYDWLELMNSMNRWIEWIICNFLWLNEWNLEIFNSFVKCLMTNERIINNLKDLMNGKNAMNKIQKIENKMNEIELMK